MQEINQQSANGWRKAIRIAMSYPGITKENGFVKSYVNRYKLNDEMLEILEQEALHESKIPRSCYKCNGSGRLYSFGEYIALCDCPNSLRYKTIGGIEYLKL